VCVSGVIDRGRQRTAEEPGVCIEAAAGGVQEGAGRGVCVYVRARVRRCVRVCSCLLELCIVSLITHSAWMVIRSQWHERQLREYQDSAKSMQNDAVALNQKLGMFRARKAETLAQIARAVVCAAFHHLPAMHQLPN